MNSMSLLFFIFLTLAKLVTPTPSRCLNNGNYTSNSNYSANLNAVLSSLPTSINSTGFYSASVGQNPDRANAIALCRADVQLDRCRECLRSITADLVKLCPYQKQAVDWYEFCTLRYSNEAIFGILETFPAVWMWNMANITVPGWFQSDLKGLLDSLRNRVAKGGSLWKFAAGNVTTLERQRIYAMMQCTPELSAEDCDSCLKGAVDDIPRCCDRTMGARVNRPSCTLRYEMSRFYNETRLQELERVSVPGPPILSPSVPGPPILSPPGKEGDNTTKIVIIVVPIAVCLIVAYCAIFFMRKRTKRRSRQILEDEVDSDEISSVESLQHDFGEIRAATIDFADANKLGQGGFGAVYVGRLPDGQQIAVKRLSRNSGQGNVEFKNEVLLVAKLQHRNLVRLLGFSREGTERLLIYEFVQNASLDHFLFDPIKRSSLDWDRCYKIIEGIARGLVYLHEDSRLRIIHRDLKPSNVLLDGDMNPKIADFGMARLFGQNETEGSTERIVGTYGYMSPEYAMHGQFSVKSDVFSFGVLVLEIISGQKNNCLRNGEDLLTFAWKHWHQGRGQNMIDHVLRGGEGGSVGEKLRCVHIGLLCVQENPGDRPTMTQVLLMLNSSTVSLPIPSKPAFFMAGSFGPDFQEYDSNASAAADGNIASLNHVTVTELYPR